MEKLKIGDSVWYMYKNKPVPWWVWVVNTNECVDTGSRYDYKVNTIVSYVFRTHKSDYHHTNEWSISHTEMELIVFKTKEELIASL